MPVHPLQLFLKHLTEDPFDNIIIKGAPAKLRAVILANDGVASDFD